MAAIKTVTQRAGLRNSLNISTLKVPRHGVVTLFGYGIECRVDRGHLILQDGIGSDRRYARLPRVAHGLRRLVVVGSDGMISLAALRWLADQNAAFVMLDRDGAMLATTGPVRPSDARLRRAQACAEKSGTSLQIARELISQKLLGQEQLVRNRLRDATVADKIAQCRAAVPTAESLQVVRILESHAGAAYWSAWNNLSVTFPRKDLPRVPNHWRIFDTRSSPLSGGPRRAANPPNAMLNYLYAVLESEASLAVAALGLDPGLGFVHMDAPSRDSLACDLMEPVRPSVDGFVLDWITRSPLSREWFFEQRDGNCRLMGSFAERLSETGPLWRQAVSPLAEWVARTLWLTMSRSPRQAAPATRLTQGRRREAKGGSPAPPAARIQPDNLCSTCGEPIRHGQRYCSRCVGTFVTEQLATLAVAGRVASRSAAAQQSRANAQRRHNSARKSWVPSSQPAWLTETAYLEKIHPLLAHVATSTIASALGVSRGYVNDIRRGKYTPHPRHWLTLAQLVGMSSDK